MDNPCCKLRLLPRRHHPLRCFYYNQKNMIRFSTAGESHGEALIALVSGLPAGLPVDLEFINRELWRRQQGYGRGGRMKIETDKAHILSGVRHGKTIGSPVAIEIVNRDWKNWEEKLPVETGDQAKHQPVASPRPGHADLAGALKYDFPDARYVLERASARESTARVAGGAFAKLLLRYLGIEVSSHVIRVGRVRIGSHSHMGRDCCRCRAAGDRAELRGRGDRSADEGRG